MAFKASTVFLRFDMYSTLYNTSKRVTGHLSTKNILVLLWDVGAISTNSGTMRDELVQITGHFTAFQTSTTVFRAYRT